MGVLECGVDIGFQVEWQLLVAEPVSELVVTLEQSTMAMTTWHLWGRRMRVP
jgi:hypothetical protein